MQLLRAIPNWDNIAKVPVPAYNQPCPEDQRSWNGQVYWSRNSYASTDVIWSRNPFNQELYVVFRSLGGKVELRPGEKVESAKFVNEWFGTTDEDATAALQIYGHTISLKYVYWNKLKNDVYRFIYEREKLKYFDFGLEKIERYPGFFMTDDLEDNAIVTTIGYALRSNEGDEERAVGEGLHNIMSAVRDAREYARVNAPAYFGFQQEWMNLMDSIYEEF